MPLSWSQVSARLDPTRWNMKTAPRSLRERGDPMRSLLDESIDVEGLLSALSERLTD
jgi:DNA primase